jgi:hypothetical protein
MSDLPHVLVRALVRALVWLVAVLAVGAALFERTGGVSAPELTLVGIVVATLLAVISTRIWRRPAS